MVILVFLLLLLPRCTMLNRTTYETYAARCNERRWIAEEVLILQTIDKHAFNTFDTIITKVLIDEVSLAFSMLITHHQTKPKDEASSLAEVQPCPWKSYQHIHM